ncbi:MAG TPA: hypothetical protein EYG74_05040 [Sulfurimonas autotrophica]|nr:hypothetical protein [Sulfurimonas autotrophica]
MKWKKLGKVFEFQSISEDLLTHTSNPMAINLENDIFRVFFSGRNKNNKSSVGFVDIDIYTKEIKQISKKTAFKYGPHDSFYSHGVSIGNIYTIDNKDYILFMGWQIRDDGHWRGDIGRLLLENNDTLTLEPKNAFMVCDDEDKVSLSYPWVIYDEGIYKMWYGSTNSWSSQNEEMIHVIKYATSNDGEIWEKHGLAIPFEIGVAQAFSRPTVIKDEDGYHMWFSYRSGDGTKYRIGYAHSYDGFRWDRKEDSGIDVSTEGWDSEMICYPFVFVHKGEKYMLYNGNDYGKTGFGLAVLEEK